MGRLGANFDCWGWAAGMRDADQQYRKADVCRLRLLNHGSH